VPARPGRRRPGPGTASRPHATGNRPAPHDRRERNARRGKVNLRDEPLGADPAAAAWSGRGKDGKEEPQRTQRSTNRGTARRRVHFGRRTEEDGNTTIIHRAGVTPGAHGYVCLYGLSRPATPGKKQEFAVRKAFTAVHPMPPAARAGSITVGGRHHRRPRRGDPAERGGSRGHWLRTLVVLDVDHDMPKVAASA